MFPISQSSLSVSQQKSNVENPPQKESVPTRAGGIQYPRKEWSIDNMFNILYNVEHDAYLFSIILYVPLIQWLVHFFISTHVNSGISCNYKWYNTFSTETLPVRPLEGLFLQCALHCLFITFVLLTDAWREAEHDIPAYQ